MFLDTTIRWRFAQLRSIGLGVACAVLCIAVPTAAVAQGRTGTLAGTVKDAQGGVIPGASITLISESQGTQSSPVITNNAGDFVVPNLGSDTYTIVVEVPSFKTLRKSGVSVTSGSRVSAGILVIEVGGASETVNVTSEIPLVQASSGERSFTVTTDAVAALPMQNRNYYGAFQLVPGVAPVSGNQIIQRTGGAPTGGNNFMIDGTTTMDPSINRPTQAVSVEAVEEVKVQTNSVSAEFGRSSGIQVNAVTKSGTNVFHGALYDVERNSDWNANTKENILSGVPKTLQSERDWGFAIGGPVGKQGGQNKLFFFFNYERYPREINKNRITRYRFPTLAERKGDFSATFDNNGNPYPYIKDYLKSGNCNATSQAACFADGGVVGKIPANRLYSTGLAILNWYPEPNLPPVAGTAYNFEIVDAGSNTVSYQPVLRVDYQPISAVRGSFRYLAAPIPVERLPGTVPGWNDTLRFKRGPSAVTGSINWTMNNKTFVEGTWGTNWNRQRGAMPSNASANIVTAGFGDLPRIYPDQWIPEPDTNWREGTLKYAEMGGTMWDGTRIQTAPRMTWGSRISPAPPDVIMPDDLRSLLWTFTGTLTRVEGSHTLKAGYYHYHAFHPQVNFDGQGINWGQDTSNIFDTTYGFANVATGVYASYIQNPRVEEGKFTSFSREVFVQDNWKVNSKLTLDYGLRVVNISQVWDEDMKTSNFLPDRWVAADAPVLYKAGCSTNVYPCVASARVALDPRTNTLLGVNSAQLVGTRVPGTGNALNGLFAAGKGIDDRLYLYPLLQVGPRVGVAWDLRGDQARVIRGGFGVFHDRTNIANMYDSVKNPPFSERTTMRFGFLQDLRASVAPSPASALWATQYDQPLPMASQWNVGVQMAVPYGMVLDVAYNGQQARNGTRAQDINNIDLGTAYLPQYQNPAAASPTDMTNPTTSYASTNPDVIRFYQGYGTISQRQYNLTRTYHSIQASVNRRFRNGLSFGFYDVLGLYDKQQSTPRLQHNADGTVTLRADQNLADELLGDQHPQAHYMRGNFTWLLPKLETSDNNAMKVLGWVVNDWSLSGIWSGATGTAYAVSASYQSGGGNLALTGSPDYAARVVVLPDVDLGGGCSSDPLRQFNTSAFRGPAVGSVGLESGNGYLKGCFISYTDLAVARVIQLGKGRTIQLRADLFNAFNQAGITGRNTTMNLTSPADPVTITNLPNEETGVRTLPVGAGFGVANVYQTPRSVQLMVRFGF